MKIQLQNIITNRKIKINEKIPQNKINLGENAKLVSPITINGFMEYAGKEEVYFEGTLKAKVILTCVKCLSEFEQEFEIPFSESYIPEKFASGNSGRENRELEELDVYTYNGIFIDTEEIARQIIIENLPPYPLCPVCRAKTK